MKTMKDGYGYNERLFSGGFRSKLHFARFKWLQAEIAKRRCEINSVLELGCFDGKLIEFLPKKPFRYAGFDANWEGGLDIARAKWSDDPALSFTKVTSPEEMRLSENEVFDMAVAMETLEHVPPAMVDSYLRTIARHLKGYLFITVPNEKGIVFLAKWLVKRCCNDAHYFSFSEVVNSTLGRMKYVERREHKGFDYAALVKSVENHFDVIEVSGHPFGFLPKGLCFGIGIVAKTRGFAYASQPVKVCRDQLTTTICAAGSEKPDMKEPTVKGKKEAALEEAAGCGAGK